MVRVDTARLQQAVFEIRRSQRELAAEAGLSPASLSRLLSGAHSRMAPARLRALADVLDVSSRWLRGTEPGHGFWDEQGAARARAHLTARFARAPDPQLLERAGGDQIWFERLEAFLGGREAVARRRAARKVEQLHEDTDRRVALSSERLGRVLVQRHYPGYQEGRKVVTRQIFPQNPREVDAALAHFDLCRKAWLRGDDLPDRDTWDQSVNGSNEGSALR